MRTSKSLSTQVLNCYEIFCVLLYFFKSIMWGQRTCDFSPLYVRAQDPSRGGILLRTYNESPNGLEI